MNNFELLLSEMEKYARENHVPVIGRDGGKLLAEIVAMNSPRSVLEIGAAIGYSALLMLSCMPADSGIVTIEQDFFRVELARNFLSRAGVIDRVNIIQGDAGQILSELEGKYDLVFIDAAKGQYLDYLHKVIDKLNEGTVIVADNVLFRGMTFMDNPPRRYRTMVRKLKAYLDFVNHDPRFKTIVHDVGDGIAVSYYQGSD